MRRGLGRISCEWAQRQQASSTFTDTPVRSPRSLAPLAPSSRSMKKAEYKGRMRMGIRKTYFSHMDIVLRHGRTVAEEQRLKVEKARRTARSIATGGVQRTSASVGMAGRSTVGTAWGY